MRTAALGAARTVALLGRSEPMFKNSKSLIVLIASALTLAVSTAAWAAKLDGDYLGTGNSFFEKLTFKSGGKVRVTFAGMVKQGTYELDGNEVLITIGNETNVFNLDAQGCVVGGGFLGKYCKGGAGKTAVDKADKASASDKASAAQGGRKAAKLSGRYKAGNPEMAVALDFKPDERVRITVSGTKAKKESTDATYKVAGDRVTISVADGSPPLVLTRKGNVLEGAPEGETMKMKFVKQ
jgi:hypothetical protein